MKLSYDQIVFIKGWCTNLLYSRKSADISAISINNFNFFLEIALDELTFEIYESLILRVGTREFLPLESPLAIILSLAVKNLGITIASFPFGAEMKVNSLYEISVQGELYALSETIKFSEQQPDCKPEAPDATQQADIFKDILDELFESRSLMLPIPFIDDNDLPTEHILSQRKESNKLPFHPSSTHEMGSEGTYYLVQSADFIKQENPNISPKDMASSNNAEKKPETGHTHSGTSFFACSIENPREEQMKIDDEKPCLNNRYTFFPKPQGTGSDVRIFVIVFILN
jgi:hypothetical protein